MVVLTQCVYGSFLLAKACRCCRRQSIHVVIRNAARNTIRLKKNSRITIRVFISLAGSTVVTKAAIHSIYYFRVYIRFSAFTATHRPGPVSVGAEQAFCKQGTPARFSAYAKSEYAVRFEVITVPGTILGPTRTV